MQFPIKQNVLEKNEDKCLIKLQTIIQSQEIHQNEIVLDDLPSEQIVLTPPIIATGLHQHLKDLTHTLPMKKKKKNYKKISLILLIVRNI